VLPADLQRLGAGVARSDLDRLANRVAPGEPRERAPIEVPFTGETLGHVPRCAPADVTAAVARAREAQCSWAARPLAERTGVFLRFHDMVLARQDEILDIIQLESGKARRHALEEVLDTAIVARYYAHTAAAHLATRRRRGVFPVFTHTVERRPPKGVIGVIAPWNYPLTLAVTDAIPALIAGNAVVVKPDEQTPYSALWVYDVLEEAGLPAGLAQVVTGRGRELGPALIDGVDYLMFTGSTATGKVVAQQAAARLIDYSMELGGKNALIVLADADIDRAVDGALRGAFSNGGQLCISAERIYVEAPVWDGFVSRFADAARRLRLGAGLTWEVEMGSLASAQQLSTVQRHVDDAVAKGAEVLAGGRHRPDLGLYMFEPTVLAGVTPAMELYEEETFGPVVAVSPVADADEAVSVANRSRYGLNFSVWTRDIRRGRAIAARLEAGTVNVNEAYAAAWASVDAPMGGFKESGVGRRHGTHGIVKYTEPQTIAVQRLVPIAPPAFLGAARYARVMNRFLRLYRHMPGSR
jgi:succinate-semialdehyde dehydrogenase/glutarate-semialdehyde dehydrogenase